MGDVSAFILPVIVIYVPRWIGNIMSRLTVDQLTRAFDAAGYDRSTSAGFISVIRERSRQLRDLPNSVRRRQLQLRARAG